MQAWSQGKGKKDSASPDMRASQALQVGLRLRGQGHLGLGEPCWWWLWWRAACTAEAVFLSQADAVAVAVC